jgi:hypothetical protein
LGWGRFAQRVLFVWGFSVADGLTALYPVKCGSVDLKLFGLAFHSVAATVEIGAVFVFAGGVAQFIGLLELSLEDVEVKAVWLSGSVEVVLKEYVGLLPETWVYEEPIAEDYDVFKLTVLVFKDAFEVVELEGGAHIQQQGADAVE